MPPKQDSHSDRITAVEGHISDITSLLSQMREDAKEAAAMTERRFQEMEKRAEERHQQFMTAKEKPSGEGPRVNANPENPKSPIRVSGESPRSTAEGSRKDKGLLPLPEAASQLRPVEISPPSFKAGSSGFSQSPKQGTPPKKIELPEFEGKNPDDWIFRVEKCFKVNQTEEEEKLTEALPCLVGCAVTWLRVIQSRDEMLDWRDFKIKLRKRFKPTGGGTVLSQMLRLRQTGTISEYREQFEELSAEVPHVPNDVLEEIFLHGMKVA